MLREYASGERDSPQARWQIATRERTPAKGAASALSPPSRAVTSGVSEGDLSEKLVDDLFLSVIPDICMAFELMEKC
jgi:hypothetical protein